MNAHFYLYDATGADEEIEPGEVAIAKLKENQLLWINILDKDEETLRGVAESINMRKLPAKALFESKRRPQIENFEDFFHFNIVSVKMDDDLRPERQPIDFIVGKNYIVTAHEGEVDYFIELRNREKAETMLGELDAESFLATLLDLHLVSYFQALEEIEHRVEKFDSKVLKTEMENTDFLSEMVELRADVSKLRRWLLPHRDIFYSLTRAHFQQIADSDSLEHYKMLNQHFESAVDSIESSRDAVLSIFDLYATKSAQLTNLFIRRLTFLTLVMGSLGVIAGTMGMNYKVGFFESRNGFWITIGAMVLIAVGLSIFARHKRWI